ncbi:MAG: AraC family transcriptional regulator [Anaerovibrio sp.]|uniref:helix-turn-helix domain-containing protein n=1 Tax=Anaerovibrio sp. TaxID=1872532 RepID=UPI0025DDCFE5|nr:AraC family transcriptional regulator [Anaerovibrio sp.]MCR5176940.1 AraC family transcriptional regulator [Anaerovibrio sp.]
MPKKRFVKECTNCGLEGEPTLSGEISFVRREKNGSESSLLYMTIMPGIDMVFNNFKADKGSEVQYEATDEEVIELNFCLEGQFSCILNDRDFTLCAGEVEAHLWGIPKKKAGFTPEGYKGITIIISTARAIASLRELFPEVTDFLGKLTAELNKTQDVVHIKATHDLIRLFKDFYHVDPMIQKHKLRLKLLEILGTLFIPAEHPSAKNQYFRAKDIEKIKAVHEQVTASLDKHYSLSELSLEYRIGKTTLQNAFRVVYGKPYYTFIKHYRMMRAVEYLEGGGMSITDIAGKLGYGNPSKFSAAFRSVYGMTPSEYRKNNSVMEGHFLFEREKNEK